MRTAFLSLGDGKWTIQVPDKRAYPDDTWPIYSSIWYCKFCFHVWAKLEVIDSPLCLSLTSTCDSCIDKWRKSSYTTRINDPVPGSLLSDCALYHEWNLDLMEVLPESLLRREFDLHLRIANEGNSPYG